MFWKGLIFLITGVAVMLTLVLGMGAAVSLPRLKRLRQLARSRNAESVFADFCAAFPDHPREHLKSIYASLQRVTGIDDFPISVEDDLWRTLELDQGSIESEIESFMELHQEVADGHLPDSAAPPVTVRDLVRDFYLAGRSNVI